MIDRSVDFDALSGNYDRLRGRARERLLPWVSEIVNYAGIRSSDRIVDIGCGTGRYTEFFAGFCGEVVGVDRSRGMLSEAVNGHPRSAEYVRSDALALPFRDGTFSAAVMIMLVHHFEQRERTVVLRETRRVLKLGGTVVVLTNSHARMGRSLWRLFPGFLDIDYRRFPDMRRLSLEMMRAGFTVGHKAVRKVFGTMSTDEYLKKVADRFVSTLALMSEKEFSDGFVTFSSRIRRLYPDSMPDEQEFQLFRGVKHV